MELKSNAPFQAQQSGIVTDTDPYWKDWKPSETQKIEWASNMSQGKMLYAALLHANRMSKTDGVGAISGGGTLASRQAEEEAKPSWMSRLGI